MPAPTARTLANGDVADAVERLAAQLPPAAARRAFATIDRGLAALERNAGPKLVAEWVAAEIDDEEILIA